MTSLINYAKEIGATSISKVKGPNGAFISFKMKDDKRVTIPVGKRSQNGTLNEYNVLIAEDTKQAIATVNHYEETEKLELETTQVLN